MSGSGFGRPLAVLVVLVAAILSLGRPSAAAPARAVATPTPMSRDCTLARTHLAHEKRPSLAGADLVGCDLRGSDLRFANLSGAIMRRADLEGANLSGANLRHADLSGAKLEGVDLFDADLSDANLLGADLRGAELAGAQLAGVRWGNTTCPDGSNSTNNGGTCLAHLTPAAATPAATPS